VPARRYPSSGDPRLKTKSYKAIVKYWQRLKPEQCEATRCLLQGIPISYTKPRTQASLDVGHIIDRDTDPRQTWTVADTRPEHQRCNRAAGLVKAKLKGANGGRRPSSTPHTTLRAVGVHTELSTDAERW
jgi:5-methylcytosine-specific restriction endonuclease McrA